MISIQANLFQSYLNIGNGRKNELKGGRDRPKIPFAQDPFIRTEQKL